MTGPEWAAPEFDGDAADAVAILTLLAAGDGGDSQMAEQLLDELARRPEGLRRAIHGLVSLSAGLLALLEFFGGIPPEAALVRLGTMVAGARIDQTGQLRS